MSYYHYHGIIKRKIKEDQLERYIYVDKYRNIHPALLLFFKDGTIKPIREYRFMEYAPLLEEWEKQNRRKNGGNKMGYQALNHTVSVITIQKNTIQTGMTCAWCMHVDYDKLLLLLGSQSDTAKCLEEGDMIGISVLNHQQKDIALHFGEKHSLETNKFQNIMTENFHDVIVIPHAKARIKAQVLKIEHLPKIEEDNLIYVEILDHEDEEIPTLQMSDM